VEFGAGGKWTLMTLIDHCQQACLTRLGLLDNVRIALGQRGERLTQVLAAGQSPEGIGPGPHLGIVLGPELAAFADQELGTESGLFLVDPLGNVMMRYPEGYDPSDVRKDLERLLKYSKVGT
jgi:cytochrome oxidase Cu insertion factor (SCO1/SenC/PrrC family)